MSEFNSINGINNNKFNSLKQVENKYNTTFDKKYYDVENNILKIFNSNNINENEHDLTNVLILYILGVYYQLVNINYDKMKKYYLSAIELNSSDAMHKLGYYYQFVEKNYDEMKKWYLMAIDLKHVKAIYNLGHHYQYVEYNYKKMKKYYWMAINLYNLSDAMNNLGVYYKDIKKNYVKMKKMYIMAINLHNSSNAMNNLGVYYKDIKKDYGSAMKYFVMSINLCNLTAYDNIKKTVANELELFLIVKNIGNKTEEFKKIYNDLKNKILINHYNYEQKYDESLQNNCVQECMICYEIKLHIKMNNCTHSVCYECYLKITICPYCYV